MAAKRLPGFGAMLGPVIRVRGLALVLTPLLCAVEQVRVYRRRARWRAEAARKRS